jgi:hypothetical protein
MKSGLANRLRALVGYETVSRLRNMRFCLCWTPTLACDATFTDLFDGSGVVLVTADDAHRLQSSNTTLTCTAVDWFHAIWRNHLPHVPWMTFLEEVHASIDRLRPAKAISEAVAAFRGAHRLSEALGVHIRHTDNVELYARRSTDAKFDATRLSTVDGFLDVIRANVDRGPVFLATDNASIERLCRAQFGEAIITYPKQYTLEWERAPEVNASGEPLPRRTTAVSEGLIDMLLLASCRRIVGTYYSSFSKFAAVWGRTDYLEIVGRAAERHPVIEATVAELRSIEASQARA